MKNSYPCKVSVLCATFNHEDYLRTTLDGFLAQKTNFPYEVLVCDDASTDSTADILREYAEKYPDIIRPFYQKENLYSRRINVYDTVFFPAARGEYIALCEGDDYWNDPEKLQRQVDWLDAHPEYSACVHNSIGHFTDIPARFSRGANLSSTRRTTVRWPMNRVISPIMPSACVSAWRERCAFWTAACRSTASAATPRPGARA